MSEGKSVIGRGEYKGKPTMSIQEETMKFPFHFGVNKAVLMVKYIDEIRKFVAENSGGEAPVVAKMAEEY